VPPPLKVTRPAPSRTVSFVKTMGEETVMVTGALPQRKTIVPPPVAAAWSAAAVQLSGLPSPTTAVGCETSCSWTGAAQVAGGAPGSAECFEPPAGEDVHARASAARRARRGRIRVDEAERF